MRRIALLSGLVLVGGLLGPSTALTSQDEDRGQNQVRWIAVQDNVHRRPPGRHDAHRGPESGSERPPVGARLFYQREAVHDR